MLLDLPVAVDLMLLVVAAVVVDQFCSVRASPSPSGSAYHAADGVLSTPI